MKKKYYYDRAIGILQIFNSYSVLVVIIGYKFISIKVADSLGINSEKKHQKIGLT